MQISAQTTGIEMIRKYGTELSFYGLVDKVNIIDNVSARNKDKKHSFQIIEDALKNSYTASCFTAAHLKASTLRVNKHLYEKALPPPCVPLKIHLAQIYI